MKTFAFCQQCGLNYAAVPDRRHEHEHEHEALCSNSTTALDVSLDVFISYSHKDAEFARRLSVKLGFAGIRHWLAEHDLGPGDDITRGISTALGRVKLVIVLLTSESAASPWVYSELYHAMDHNLRILAVLLERFRLPDDIKILVGRALWADVSDRPEEIAIEDVCRHARDNLRKIAAAGQRSAPVAEAPVNKVALKGVRHRDHPYVGPTPYKQDQKELFCGRDEYARSILDTLQRSSIALYAPSGAGKTSLLHARIRGDLEADGWEVLVGGPMRIDPPAHLLGSISNRISFLVNCGLTSFKPPDPRRGVADQLLTMPRLSGRRVLILDQFEEIFAHHKDRSEDRSHFFRDLVEALDVDPALRILVAFRQEFLADFEDLTEGTKGLFTRVHLKRMSNAEAREVITRPVASYARFAPGVAEEIVKHLSSRPGGGTAEFIELVHLQIVCQELWLNLEEGITEIRQTHVERAAQGCNTLKEFVGNVLQSFVNKTVREAAAERGTSPELIHFGLLKFVKKSGGRVTLPMDSSRNRTGRLRNDIVEHLADKHLLRAETRGEERWYELSHDLLAEPVAQYRNPKLTKLLVVTDLLATLLERAREECKAAARDGRAAGRPDCHLPGYFGAHRDLLEEFEPVYDPQLLDAADEAELVFRASLACGDHMGRWTVRLGETFPEIRECVLRDAVTHTSPLAARRNAVKVLGRIPVLGRELVPVALRDPREEVRDTAAASLAALDSPDLYADVVSEHGAHESSRWSPRTLAGVLAEAENRGITSHTKSFAALPRSTRRRIRTSSWRLRLRRAATGLSYVVLCAAILSGIGAGFFKWIPTAFDVGITQLSGSPFMGFYQGFVAGASFGALIALALSVHYVISARRRASSYFRPVLPIVFGIVSGASSGFLVDLIILNVYSAPTLTSMHWISNECVQSHFAALLDQVFFESHFGWCFVISGAFLGGGVALVSNRLRNWDDWLPVLRQEDELTGLRQAAIVVLRIARVALPYAMPIAVALAIAAPLAAWPVSPLEREDCPLSRLCPAGERPKSKEAPCAAPNAGSGSGRQSKGVWDVVADCGCQVTGGFLLIVGMGFGIVLIRRGMHISRHRRA